MGRNQTDVASEMMACYPKMPRLSTILTESEKNMHINLNRQNDLLTEMLFEEQYGGEVSQTYEELPNSRASAVAEKLPRVRKRSSDKSRMSDHRLIEDAERYIEDFIKNIEDTDSSSFDGERGDGSSVLGAMVKGRDYAPGDAEICRTPARSTTRPVEMNCPGCSGRLAMMVHHLERPRHKLLRVQKLYTGTLKRRTNCTTQVAIP